MSSFSAFLLKHFADLAERHALGVVCCGEVPAGCQRLLLMVAEARMRRLMKSGEWKPEVMQ